MRLLNLLLTVLASRKPSTERPLSPGLVNRIICIVTLSVASGVLAASLLIGLHIALFYALVTYGWDILWAFVAVAALAGIIFAWVVGELVYKAKHLISDFMPKRTERSLVEQVVSAPEAFLKGLIRR